jgi:hypothetical protein
VVGTTNLGGGASEVGATVEVATGEATRTVAGVLAAGLAPSGVAGPLSGAFAGASGCCLLMMAFSTSPGFEI